MFARLTRLRPTSRFGAAALGALFALAAVPAGVSVLGFTAGLATPAAAQDRCADLWYARNEIYARNGYCFKTARGRAAFGAGCFPPYGRLSGAEKRQVGAIEREEYALGCR